jgi:microcystin-dependent protein
MASASVTNTFTASTAAVASQVNRNFDDLVVFANDSTIHRDGSKPFTGEVSLGTFKITNVAPGSAADDAATVGQLAGTLPTGFIVMYSAAVSPAVSWLVCDGTAISRTSYSDLFGIIGTSFGVGDGATTFNIPDLQNRFPYGGTVGVQGGSDDAVTVSHTHVQDSHGHTASTSSSTSVTGGSHSHSITQRSGTAGAASGSSVNSNIGLGGSTSGASGSLSMSAGTTSSTTVADATAINQSTGVSGVGLNRPAFTGVQFLIKSGL